MVYHQNDEAEAFHSQLDVFLWDTHVTRQDKTLGPQEQDSGLNTLLPGLSPV